jgi:tetratricopeptide (TPR) repeat protein
MDLNAQLQRALSLHQQGQLLEAGEIYRQILAVDPNHVDALNLMGVVMQAAGDLEMAETLITTATELAPDYFAPFANLGNVLQAAGRIDAAIEAFGKALALNPESVESANNLASALNEKKDFAGALAASEKALSLIAAFPEALVNKGNALLGLGQAADAVLAYEAALDLAPAHSNANFNLGNAYMDLEAYADAVEPYRAALAADPKNPEKHFNLANALMKADRLEECLAAFEHALALRPDYVDALCNHASALQSLGRTGDAVARLQKALAFQPDSADLHWNLSLAALQHGDYATGWREYEWRWEMPTFANFKRDFTAPRWDGTALDGTLFIHTEQGFGDNLQFCRYVTLAAAKAGRVVLECRPELRRLLDGIAGVDATTELGDPVPDCDAQIPLMSLPHVFATTLETVPADIPYLQVPGGVDADPRITEAAGFKVGLAWAGSPTRVDNHKRSIALEKLAPLVAVEGASFFNLQMGLGKEELDGFAAAGRIADITDIVTDFADTAANVAALDLIVSVDTALLHLAGALGKRAWGLMSQPTGFLWMNDRTDSPWYPNTRLFRQPRPGDWENAVAAAAEALAAEV